MYSLDNIANSTDRTFDNSDQATLSGVEVNVGIICACLPSMRPLFALMMPKYFSSAPAYRTVPAHDIERPKDVRALSVSTRVDTPTRSVRPSYSQNGSDLSIDTRQRASDQFIQRTQSRKGSASMAHSRSGSNPSVPVPLRSTTGPFQGKTINPLRMSPVTPFAPPIPFRLGGLPEDDTSTLAPSVYSRRPSEASINLTRLTSKRPPRTPVSTKPLPLTPFPVGSGDWGRTITAIPRPVLEDA